jgi:hypothetical protein
VGICDWASARRAPALSDLARCRAALTLWPGRDAPNVFLDHYQRMTGRPLEGLPLWDLFWAYLALRFGRDWMAIYDAAGVEFALEPAMSRVSAMADRAAAELDLPIR